MSSSAAVVHINWICIWIISASIINQRLTPAEAVMEKNSSDQRGKSRISSVVKTDSEMIDKAKMSLCGDVMRMACKWRDRRRLITASCSASDARVV